MNKKRLARDTVFKLRHPQYKYVHARMRELLGGVNNATILRYIRNNAWNGLLTTDAVLEMLESELHTGRDLLLESKKLTAYGKSTK